MIVALVCFGWQALSFALTKPRQNPDKVLIQIMPSHPALLDIIKARRFLKEHLAPTPMYRSAGFSEALDLELHVKYENFQPIRSYKVRGGL